MFNLKMPQLPQSDQTRSGASAMCRDDHLTKDTYVDMFKLLELDNKSDIC